MAIIIRKSGKVERTGSDNKKNVDKAKDVLRSRGDDPNKAIQIQLTEKTRDAVNKTMPSRSGGSSGSNSSTQTQDISQNVKSNVHNNIQLEPTQTPLSESAQQSALSQSYDVAGQYNAYLQSQPTRQGSTMPKKKREMVRSDNRIVIAGKDVFNYFKEGISRSRNQVRGYMRDNEPSLSNVEKSSLSAYGRNPLQSVKYGAGAVASGTLAFGEFVTELPQNTKEMAEGLRDLSTNPTIQKYGAQVGGLILLAQASEKGIPQKVATGTLKAIKDDPIKAVVEMTAGPEILVKGASTLSRGVARSVKALDQELKINNRLGNQIVTRETAGPLVEISKDLSLDVRGRPIESVQVARQTREGGFTGQTAKAELTLGDLQSIDINNLPQNTAFQGTATRRVTELPPSGIPRSTDLRTNSATVIQTTDKVLTPVKRNFVEELLTPEIRTGENPFSVSSKKIRRDGNVLSVEVDALSGASRPRERLTQEFATGKFVEYVPPQKAGGKDIVLVYDLGGSGASKGTWATVRIGETPKLPLPSAYYVKIVDNAPVSVGQGSFIDMRSPSAFVVDRVRVKPASNMGLGSSNPKYQGGGSTVAVTQSNGNQQSVLLQRTETQSRQETKQEQAQPLGTTKPQDTVQVDKTKQKQNQVSTRQEVAKSGAGSGGGQSNAGANGFVGNSQKPAYINVFSEYQTTGKVASQNISSVSKSRQESRLIGGIDYKQGLGGQSQSSALMSEQILSVDITQKQKPDTTKKQDDIQKQDDDQIPDTDEIEKTASDEIIIGDTLKIVRPSYDGGSIIDFPPPPFPPPPKPVIDEIWNKPPPRRLRNPFDSEGDLNARSGFDVFARVKGQFKKVNLGALSEGDAENYLKDFLENTPSASGFTRSSSSSITQSFKKKISSKGFKKKGNLFIELASNRINTRGELEGITRKGIFAIKNKR